MLRAALPVAAAAALIVSAPFVQSGFTAVSTTFPGVGMAATALPIAVAVIVAAVRIRARRWLRFSALASSLTIGAIYALTTSLSFAEGFHFVEYGLLAGLFYAALGPGAAGAIVLLPLMAGIATGILDEWFQWFIPIRAGEMRDIGLDAVASLCGLLFAISVQPPRELTLRLERRSATWVALSAAGLVVLFGFFLVTVHVGYEVRDPVTGAFLSRYTAAQLTALADDRSLRWRLTPPVTVRRLWREDQYLSEGLWRAQQRNQAWQSGDMATAWRENLILERFFSPVLDVPTYASSALLRWPPEQRAEAASHGDSGARSPARADYRYPLYVIAAAGS
jgi:VanZ family protein